MAIRERGIEIKRSRVSYFYNYILIILVIVFFALVWGEYELTFSLLPTTSTVFWKSMVVLGFVAAIGVLLEEPTIYRMFCNYMITNDEVIKIEGIIRKRRTLIPYQSVANVTVYKGVLGRILNFGDINITGFRNNINMEGIREPEVFYRIINNKIAVMRRASSKSGGVEKIVEGAKVMSTDWRKEQKSLDKEIRHPAPMKAAHLRRREKSDIFGFLRSFRPADDEVTEGTEYIEEIEEGKTDEEDARDTQAAQRKKGKSKKIKKRKKRKTRKKK